MAGDASISSKIPRELPASYLKEITDNFSEDRVIGSSVFGKVYKGVLGEGDIIAVKRLDTDSLPSTQSFNVEVGNLMALQHDNIVELVGYCYEGKKDVVHHNGKYMVVDVKESYLLYPFLHKGTLDKYLNDDLPTTLDWDTRFKIIKGICQGVNFLHNKSDGPLIHMNIHPSSIWLDDNWVPQIADFGLSRIFGQEQTRINTMHVMGKYGYMAPEYLYRGEISMKSDIYSLGMLILEITTGEKNCGSAEDRAARNFVNKVHRVWVAEDKMTPKYSLSDSNGLQQVKACIKIGLKCVETEGNKRPSIDDIVNKLNGEYVPIIDEVLTLEPLSRCSL